MAGIATEPVATDKPQGQSSEFDDAFEAFASGDTPAPASAAEGDADPEPQADPEPREPAFPEVRENTDAAAPAAPAQPATDDIDWNSVPAIVRAAYERTQQENRSLKGRQSSLDRELHSLRSRQTTPSAVDAGTPDKKSAAPIDEEKLKALREDYPEIAGPLLDLLEDLRTKQDRLSGSVKGVEDDRTEAFLQRQMGSLTELMPDWRTWGADTRFETWITAQPRHVQEAAARNADYVVDAAEAHDVLSRFKAAHAAPAEDPKPDPKRERQLGALKDATTKAPATASGVPDDFGAAFDHHAKKLEQGRSR